MATESTPGLGAKEAGFTLIELLVVIIIIGILASIALPVFLNQRNKAFDTAAKSDARNLASFEEAYAADAQPYVTFDSASTPYPTGFDGFKPSKNTQTKAAPSLLGYCIVSLSKSGKYFVYDSQAGGLDNIGKTAAPTTGAAGSACQVSAPSWP